jgi:hypothetical protein
MDIEKLKALSELKEKGILSDEEFQSEKNKILSAQNTTHADKQPENDKGNLVVIGYVMSVIPILILPIVFTIIGVALGVVNMSRGKVGHGSAQFGISVFCGIMGTAIGGAGFRL